MKNDNLDRLRNLSSAFSRHAFIDVLNYNDYSHFDGLLSKYPVGGCATYFDFLEKSYSLMAKDYRCEYVFKNELIKLLLRKYAVKDTVYFSEFRAGNSIADMATFNSESKAFEIKTEYDTVRRLGRQMEDYKRFFDKCYIVIPETKLERYAGIIEPATGIVVLKRGNGRLVMEEIKPARQNERFEPEVLMSCLRTEEYKNIASALGAPLDGVPGYNLFMYCSTVISHADHDELKRLFLRQVKKRKNNTALLSKYPMPLRQMMLSLNLPETKASKLLNQLNININKA